MRFLLLSLALLLATALAPAHAQKALPGLSEGVQYTYIEDGQPYQTLPPGMVEVAEVFAYTCPHCADFSPMLDAWGRQLPPHARLTLVPFVSGRDDAWARTFYAAQAAKALPVLHPRLFAAVHETGDLPRTASLEQITTFATRIPGVNGPAFQAALRDEPGQLARLRAAFEFERRSNVESTPTLIVGGRYMILGNSFEGLLANARRVVDALAPAKPAARVAPKPAPKPAAAKPAAARH